MPNDAATNYSAALSDMSRDTASRIPVNHADAIRLDMAVWARLGISFRFLRSAGYLAVCPVVVLAGRLGVPLGGVQGETRFPPMAPLGGLFATQRCHRVENKRGRRDRYEVDVRFGRSADAKQHNRNLFGDASHPLHPIALIGGDRLSCRHRPPG